MNKRFFFPFISNFDHIIKSELQKHSLVGFRFEFFFFCEETCEGTYTHGISQQTYSKKKDIKPYAMEVNM